MKLQIQKNIKIWKNYFVKKTGTMPSLSAMEKITA